MIKALSKSRSSKELLSIHMKFILIVVIGFLFWNSNDARQFTAETLDNMSEFIEPKPESIGEKIDSFLN